MKSYVSLGKYAALCAFFFLLVPIAMAEMMFGYVGFKSDDLSALPRWQRVLERLEAEKTMFHMCDQSDRLCVSYAVSSWRDYIRSQQDKTRLQQVKNINRFVNKWPYITDSRLWGLSDYWATPLEFLEHSGDCEDYAIVKYVSLRDLGVPAEDLRLLVVRDSVRDIAHAILGVKVDKKWLMMDSLFTAVLEQDKLLQYTPYYAVNETSRWTYIPPLGAKK